MHKTVKRERETPSKHLSNSFSVMRAYSQHSIADDQFNCFFSRTCVIHRKTIYNERLKVLIKIAQLARVDYEWIFFIKIGK